MRLIRHLFVPAAILLAFQPAQAAELRGAGSSAAQPLYTALSTLYAKSDKTVFLYQPSGSSDGLKQIKAGTVDFGATDIAMSPEERKAARLISFPTAISGVVPVLNVPGVRKGQLQLTGEVLAELFSRKIVKWNDPKLRALNPGVTLPDLAVTVIARQDGSGTTYNFSDYLSKASAAWQSGFGRNFTITWPAGTTLVKGSSGAVAALKQTSGAITYVDYQYAVKEALAFPQLKNRDGKFVSPGAAGFSAALANSGWVGRAAYEEMLTDKPGAATWPITTGTFIVLPQTSSKPEQTIAAIKFFTWGFIHGDAAVGKADFVRLPDAVQGRIFGELTTITDSAGAPLKWSLSEVMK